MFMKHTISRFFRFFLVAALVAALAGSLLPTAKVAGQATCTARAADTTVTPNVMALACVTASSNVAGQNASWTIKFVNGGEDVAIETLNADGDVDMAGGAIELTFANADVTDGPIAGAVVTVASSSTATDTDTDDDTVTAGPAAEATRVRGTVTGAEGNGTLSFNSPVGIAVGATATIEIAAVTEDDASTTTMDESGTAIVKHQDNASDMVSVTVTTPASGASAAFETLDIPTVVTPKTLRAGQVAQWEIVSTNTRSGLVANVDKITLTFTSGSVPSSIDRNDIIVRTDETGLANAAAGPAASTLTVVPTISGKSITFFSPVTSAAAATAEQATADNVDEGDSQSTVRIVIALSAGVAAGNKPGDMAVKVTLGSSVAATSGGVNVGQYLDISPSSAARHSTVTVTGGGFTAGTSGGILIEDGPDDDEHRDGTGGDYTVDSSGKLSGSFVASGNTAHGGAIIVQDLGSGTYIDSSKDFAQKASAVASANEVTRGGTLPVQLNDFPEGNVKATIVDDVVSGDGTEDPEEAGDNTDPFPTKGAYKLNVPQGITPGTKRVVIEVGVASDSFLITIVSRTLTVSPSSVVPGQAVTVTGSGFNSIDEVDLTLGSMDVPGGEDIDVNTDGTFLYANKVPFTSVTASAGSKTWRAVDGEDSSGRAATSSGFTIQKRAITLSPSTANPGSTVEVFGSGWGVTTRGVVNSEVVLDLWDASGKQIGSAVYGPFPVSSSGEFTGAITIPTSVGVSSVTVRAVDNNGSEPADNQPGVDEDDLTQAFEGANKTATATLRVPQGVISVSPDSVSTGTVITVSGKGFPAQTNLSELMFGTANALPVPAPATDINGNFTVTLTVPAAPQGGSLPPGAVVIKAKVQSIVGTTSFTIPGPEITLSTGEARPGETITLSGTGFSAYSNVGTINVGQQNQSPTPNPLTDGVGDFSSTVLIPALNPGAYTITVRTDPQFTATAPITILSSTVGNAVPAGIAFQALTSRGLLTLAAAAAPGGTEFGAFVPGLAGNTLVNVEPNGVLVLTLNADARIAVSGQPAVDVAADTPTFFALGSVVSIEVVQ